MTQEEIDELLEKLKEQGILKSIGLSQREIDNRLKRGSGFTDQEVKDIVDDAIYYAEKRTFGHFVDLIVHKRFDENDMIILREKDFMHD